MHGPQVKINGINRKKYLCAIIDDHSRMIVHAKFYNGETLENLKNCLMKAATKQNVAEGIMRLKNLRFIKVSIF